MATTETVTQETTVLGLTPSFGFGDRIGLATPGHVAAMRAAGGSIAPMFAQQSIREMARTNRTPEGVMSDALQAAASAGWDKPQGSDADHLKTPEDVDRTAAVGFKFFTIDPSDHVDQQADDYDAQAVKEKFAAIADSVTWLGGYEGKEVTLPSGTKLTFDQQSLQRAGVKYGKALEEAIKLADYIKSVQEAAGRDYEIELSVDETEQPTTLVEHWIIAEQCLTRGVKLVSLAPRFIGEME
ncbi:MAG: tagaturonate epimerase family protein, partial [Lacipirellulaceae bacterium]